MRLVATYFCIPHASYYSTDRAELDTILSARLQNITTYARLFYQNERTHKISALTKACVQIVSSANERTNKRT